MRSSELASLAKVTVRTLRHYHQLGILPEPPRSGNGYRRYDVHDLIRVLRIKRLAALGFPLQDVAGLLDRPDAQAESRLDELDAELAAEIDRLTAQRALLAALRGTPGLPDLPPELAGHPVLRADSGLSPALARVDREQTILLAHLAGDDGMALLTRFYDRLAEPGMFAVVTALSARFSELDARSDEETVQALADDMTAAYAPLVHEFAGTTVRLDGAAALLDAHSDDTLNPAQRRVVTLLATQLA